MTSATSSLRTAWRPLRRVLLLHRRPLALALAAVSALAMSAAVRPAPAPTEAALVAATDLSAGTRLDGDDLVRTEFVAGTRPAYAARTAGPLLGRVLAVGVRRGEPLGTHRLAGGAQRAAAPGLTTVPVRIADAASLLAPGDVIDLLASSRDGEAVTVARQLPVIGHAGSGRVDSPVSTPAPGGPTGQLVLLGVPPSQVEGVVGASSAGFLFYTFSP